MKLIRVLSYLSVVVVLMSCFNIDNYRSGRGSREATLKIVMGRDMIKGGVTTGVPGYSAPDSAGNWQGFDVDLLRAVAAAVLGDADKVAYQPLNAKERFTALQTGEIDVLSRVSTWTTVRDTTLGINWAGISFYDGQAIMVSKKSGINSISDLNGASISVQSGTTTELNLSDYFRSHNLRYELVTFDQNEQAVAALEAGRVDAYSSDSSQLYALRSKMAHPNAYKVLATLISKEPLGPVVREGDDQWMDIIRWVFNAMIVAEEFGITSQNVDQVKQTTENPEEKRFLGMAGSIGKGLGLDAEWAYRIIKQVGNYGEVFERNLGSGSPLKMERGVNKLWINGGLQYPLPFR